MRDIFIKLFSYISGLIVIAIMLFIFIYIFLKGYKVIDIEFLFSIPKGMPLGESGGIFPAIIGSLYLGILSSLISSVLSILTAMYLCFYCRNKKIYNLIKFSIQSISGLPSIVIGLFGYSFCIMKLGIPKSLLSAGITLSIMIIPYITLRVEKIFNEFSKNILEASLSLGVSKVYSIRKIVLPNCKVKILQSISLSVAYAMGATAPIMFTGAVIFANSPRSIKDPFMALPYHLYILISEGYSINMAYGTAFVLMIIIFVINLSCYFSDRREKL